MRILVLTIIFGLLLTGACLSADDDDDSSDDATPDDDDTGDDDDDDDATPVEYDYDVPVKSTSPWPMHRRTSRNTGQSPIMPVASARPLWAFETGKGMFHEPVLDEDGTVYMGSADTRFYAVDADGNKKWEFPTEQIIDSTALIAGDGHIYLPAGDGYLYKLTPDGQEVWRVSADAGDAFIPWWEGHIAMGLDGTLYAGNDDRHLYAIDQSGVVKWKYKTIDQIWSCPAIGPEGDIYFGANDFMVRSVDTAGARRWWSVTLGPVGGSVAVHETLGLLLAGSFDGYLHAYNLDNGKQVWKFAARDHFYASPSIADDGTIYVGSTDGTLYAINPDGTLKWAFDTLDPIRSSAAVDGEGNVYFGGGDGKLYALRDDGVKLWSFDTTEGDRNDLNGSPAIGPDGLYIGGEAGTLWFVPFGYCENSDDERCDLSPDEAIPDDGAFVYRFTNGGSSQTGIEQAVNPTEVLTFRLVVRSGGDTVRARIDSDELNVTITPSFLHRLEVSADGNFFSIIPENPLPMDAQYQVAIAGEYLTGGWRVGNRLFGGEKGGDFAGSFSFTTAAPTGRELPLTITDSAASVLLLRRLAVPQPPMMTTFNQIGFDSYNFLVGAVSVDPANERFVLLAIEGTTGLDPVLNPETKSVFPLNGTYEDSYFAIDSQGFRMEITGVSIALDLFRVSGLLEEDLTSDALNCYAEVTCANVEFFGFALNLLGLCHPLSNKMIVNGTALFAPAGEGLGVKPDGLAVISLTHAANGGWHSAGTITAQFNAATLSAGEHVPVILLIDPATGEGLDLDYGFNLEKLTDGQGMLTGVRLHLPEGFEVDNQRAVVVVNLYPLYEETL